MAYTLDQLSTYYDSINSLVNQLATSTEINTLTALLSVQHTTLLDLVTALTTRIQNLEDWKIAHQADYVTLAARVTALE